jgi:hypothetical protein
MYRRWSVWILLGLLTAGCTAAPTTPANPTPPPSASLPWTSLRLQDHVLGFDGRHLFVAQPDGSQVTQLPVPTPAAPLEAAVAGSASANQVAVLTIGRETTVHFLDLATGTDRLVPLGAPGPPRGLAWSKDGRWLAWGIANTVGIISFPSKVSVELARGGTVTALVGVTPEGAVAYQSEDRVLLARGTSEPQMLTTGLADTAFASPLSPDGRWLVVSRCTDLCQGSAGKGPDYASIYDGFALDRQDGSVRQVTRRRPVAGLAGRGATLGWLPEGSRFLWVVRLYSDQPSLPDTVFRIDAASGELQTPFAATDLYALRVSPDARTLYAHTICCARATRSPGFYTIDLTTKKVTALSLPDATGMLILGVY